MINDTLTLTYMRADSVMLGIFKGPVAVGLYQAGTNLVLYFNVLARSINRAALPADGPRRGPTASTSSAACATSRFAGHRPARRARHGRLAAAGPAHLRASSTAPSSTAPS